MNNALRGHREDPHWEAPRREGETESINYSENREKVGRRSQSNRSGSFAFNEGVHARPLGGDDGDGGGGGARAEESHYRASINGAVSRGIRD